MAGLTYALTLIKGKTGKREQSISLLNSLKKDPNFTKDNGVEIKELFISFGWPDIILLLKSENVELIKRLIVILREKAATIGDDLTTSSIICTTQDEMDSKLKKWGKVVCP